jgi:Flp pilus assembly pilin Flp
MTIKTLIKNFAADESGAVTVDWVVLTAAIVGLGLAVVTSVRSGVTSLGSSISGSLSSASVATLGTLGVSN